MSEDETIDYGQELPDDLPLDSLQSYNPERSQVIPSIKRSIGKFADMPTESWGLTKWTVAKEPGGELPPDFPVPINDSEDDETTAYSPVLPIADPDLVARGHASFKLRKIVGQGGFGEVWEALQTSLDRIVAVKRLRSDLQDRKGEAPGSQGELERNFHQEALTTANLDHPNIVPVHDLGLDEDGSPLLAMKFVRGTPWHELIMEEFNAMSVPDFLAKHIPILVDVTQAVAFAHSRGVIHRDLKPSQVIVGEFGEVMLMDWGLAVVFDPEALAKVTQSDSIKASFLPTPHSASNPAGTLSFMAPEQTAPNASHIGPWTDVYLLGGTLYYLLTGRPPHTGQESREVFLKARMGEVIPPTEAVPGREIPPELEDLALDALQANYEERMQTAKDFLAGLQDYLSGASKRRESLVITEYVAMTLSKGGKDYHKYSDCLSELTRAQALWGENPDVTTLRERTLEEYSREALAHGDLVLARLLVQTMSFCDSQVVLTEQLEKEEARSRGRERQRRLATIGMVVLAVIIIAGVAVFSYKVAKERDIARQERDRARLAQNNATVLVNFMLTDLKESLEPTGQLEPLLRVSERVSGYFKKFSEEDKNITSEGQHALALYTMGMINLEMGRTEEALSTFQDYQAIASKLAADPDAGEEWARNLVQGHVMLARILNLQGDTIGAEEHIGRAISAAVRYASRDASYVRENLPGPREISEMLSANRNSTMSTDNMVKLLTVVDSLASWNKEDPTWQTDIAIAYEKIGELLEERNDFLTAQEAHQRAIELHENALGVRPNEPTWIRGLINSYIDLGRAFEGQANIFRAKESYEKALTLAQNARKADPQRHEYLGDISLALSHIAGIQDVQGNNAAAEDGFRQSVSLANQLADIDQQNASWQHGLALRYRDYGDFHLSNGDMQNAQDMYDRVVPVLERIVLQDQRNRQWRNDLSDTFERFASLGDKELQDGNTEKARETHSAILRRSGNIITTQNNEADAYIQPRVQAATGLARILLASNNTQSASEQIAPMIEVLNREIVISAPAESEEAQAEEGEEVVETPELVRDRVDKGTLGRFYFVAALVSVQGSKSDEAFERLDQAAALGYKVEEDLRPLLSTLEGLRSENAERYDRTVRSLGIE